MTGADGPYRVVIWVTERTWQASVDAARQLAPAGSSVTLLHVTPEEPPDTAHAAYLGLFGRGRPGRDPGPRIADISAASAAEADRRRRAAARQAVRTDHAIGPDRTGSGDRGGRCRPAHHGQGW